MAYSLAERAVLAADTDVWLKELPQDLLMFISLIYLNKVDLPFPQKKKKKKRKKRKVKC